MAISFRSETSTIVKQAKSGNLHADSHVAAKRLLVRQKDLITSVRVSAFPSQTGIEPTVALPRVACGKLFRPQPEGTEAPQTIVVRWRLSHAHVTEFGQRGLPLCVTHRKIAEVGQDASFDHSIECGADPAWFFHMPLVDAAADLLFRQGNDHDSARGGPCVSASSTWTSERRRRW